MQFSLFDVGKFISRGCFSGDSSTNGKFKFSPDKMLVSFNF